MKDDVEKLLIEFHKIYSKGWIVGVNNDVSGVGLTFEKMIGKKVDSELFPDYNGIEIKCTQRFSGYPIGLFNKSLDGPRMFETNFIVSKYGSDYYEGSDKKYLFVNFEYDKFVLINEKYYFKMFISEIDERLYFNIYDLEYNLLDTSYIEFNTIKEHLEIKLKNLAIIYASKRKTNIINFFRYYCLQYYKLKSIDKFFELIRNNVIKISLVCRASYSKNINGKQKNKGINFKISKKDIEKLFDKVFEYNADEKKININSEFIFKNVDILSLGDLFEKNEYMATRNKKEYL